MRTLLAPQPLFPSSVYHSASKLPVPPSFLLLLAPIRSSSISSNATFPHFSRSFASSALSLFLSFSPSLSPRLHHGLFYPPSHPLYEPSPPLPTLVPDVDPFRPVPVSLRSSSFSNSPRWHHRPLCSSLDAEERLNANHRAATGPWLFCLPREVWYVVMVWRSAVHPRKKRLHSLLWFRGLLSTEIRTAYERQTHARTTPAG